MIRQGAGRVLQDCLSDVAVGLATSYAFVGAILAMTIVAALNVAGLVRIPRAARPVFLALFAVSIVGFVAAWSVGLLKSPSRAAAEIAAAAESDAASTARARNVTRLDDPATTGAIPAGTVYIQVPDMDARFEADGLWKALQAAGFRSPGIELVTSGSPARPQARYFNETDQPIAQRVAEIAARQGLAGALAVRAEANFKAPPGQIEFWYPR